MPAQIIVNPISLDFGTIAIQDSKQLSFVVHNYGIDTLNCTLSCADSHFVLSSILLSISSGHQATVDVTFSSIIVGNFSSEIIIDSNDPNSPVTLIPVQGISIASSALLVPTSLDFGTISIYDTKQLQITVTNTSSVKLIVSDIVSSNNKFTVSPKVFSVTPGQNQIFNVTFSPADTISSFSEHLTVKTNSTSGDINVPAQGVSVSAGIYVNKTSIDFGPVTIGDTLTQTVIVSNISIDNVKLILSNVSSTNSVFVQNISTAIVNKGTALLISIIFSPVIAALQTGKIIIACNDVVLSPVEINLSGSGIIAPNIKLSTTSINFGNVPINSSLSKTFIINNVGQMPLNITSISITNEIFHVSPSIATIPAGSLQQFSVYFYPVTPNHVDAILTIANNDPDSQNTVIDLQGNGISSAIILNPNSLDFLNTTVKQTKQLPVLIQNNSSVTLIVDNIVSNNIAFKIIDDLLFPISITLSKQINIEFKPSIVGIISGMFVLTTNDYNNLSKQLDVVGVGVSPDIVINPLHLSFFNVRVGTTYSLPVSIHNVGLGVLSISSITSSDTDSFSVAPTSLEVAPGSQTTFNVIFTPIVLGNKFADIQLINNTFDQPDIFITVDGCGAYPIVLISTTELVFGNISVNDNKELDFIVYNTGSVSLSVSMSIEATTIFSIVGSSSFLLLSNASQSVKIKFSPIALGSFSDILIINTNDPLKPINIVSLSGAGVTMPKISVSPDVLTFEPTQVNNSRQLYVVISNTGNMQLNYSILIVNPVNPGLHKTFSVNLTSGSVAINSTQQIIVAFNPNYSDDLLGELRISSNDSNNSQVNVQLRGRGIPAILQWKSISTDAWIPSTLKSIANTLNDIVDPLVTGLDATKQILDIAKEVIIYLTFDDPLTILLNQIKKLVSNFIDDLSAAGLFVLQVLPGKSNINPLMFPQYYKNFNKDDLSAMLLTNGWYDSVKGGYSSFVQKVVQSFDDPGDGNRPQFSSDAMIGGYVMMFDSGDFGYENISKFIENLQKLLRMFNDKTFKTSYEPPSDIIALSYDGVINLTFTPSKSMLPKEFFIFRSKTQGGDIVGENNITYVDEQARIIRDYELVGITNVVLQLAYELKTTFGDANNTLIESFASSIELANKFLKGDPIRFIFEDKNVENGQNYYYVVAAGYTTDDISFHDVFGVIDKQKLDNITKSKYDQIISKKLKTSDFNKKIAIDADFEMKQLYPERYEQQNCKKSSETHIANIGVLSAEISAKPVVFVTSTNGLQRCRNYRCGFDIETNQNFLVDQSILLKQAPKPLILAYVPISGTISIEVMQKNEITNLDSTAYRVDIKSKSIYLVRPNLLKIGDSLLVTYSYKQDLQKKQISDDIGILDSQQTYSTKHKPIDASTVKVFEHSFEALEVPYSEIMVINDKDGKIKVNRAPRTTLTFAYSYYSDFSNSQYFKCVISDKNKHFFDVSKCDSGSTLCPKYDNAKCYFNNGSSCTNKDVSTRDIVGPFSVEAGSLFGVVPENIPFVEFFDPIACQNGIMQQRCDGYSKVAPRYAVKAWPDWSAYRLSALNMFPKIEEAIRIMEKLLDSLLGGTDKIDAAIITFIDLLQQKIDFLKTTINTVNSSIQNLIQDFSLPNVYFLSIPFSKGGNEYLKTSIANAINGPNLSAAACTAGVVLVVGTPGLANALKLIFG